MSVMNLGLPKDFFDALPIIISPRQGTAKARTSQGIFTFPVGVTCSVYDFQVLLGILYMFTQEQVAELRWQTYAKGMYIPIASAVCKWRTFVEEYCKKPRFQKTRIYASLNNLTQVRYDINTGNGTGSSQWFLWKYQTFFEERLLYIELNIDGNLWKKCQGEETLINIAPILNLRSPLGILLGTWVQIQGSSSAEEGDLFSRFGLTRSYYTQKKLHKAFDLLRSVKIVKAWRFVESHSVYCWEL